MQNALSFRNSSGASTWCLPRPFRLDRGAGQLGLDGLIEDGSQGLYLALRVHAVLKNLLKNSGTNFLTKVDKVSLEAVAGLIENGLLKDGLIEKSSIEVLAQLGLDGLIEDDSQGLDLALQVHELPK